MLGDEVEGKIQFLWPFSSHHDRSHPLTIAPKLALPYKDKIPQGTGSQLFDRTPALEVPETPLSHSLQEQDHPKGPQPRQAIQNVQMLSPAEESISHLDTLRMFSVSPGEVEQQQQNIFINAVVEDITYRDTVRIPSITWWSEQQVETEQQQDVVNTAGSAAIAGVGELIFAVLRYVTNVVMTNIVSQSIYGIFVTTYTCVTIISYIANLGLDSATLRFLSTYRAQDDHNRAAGLIRFVLWMTLISGLLCGALFFLGTTALAHFVYHNDVYEVPFKEAALLIPLLAVQLTLSNGLFALKAIKWKVYVDRLIQPALTLVFIGVFYLLGLRLEALILAMICGLIASVITGKYFLGKASRPLVHNAVPKFEPKVWLGFSLPMFLSSMIQSILNSTDVLFLAAFATTAQVGLYSAADRMSGLVVIPLVALNLIFSPLIAEYYARGERKQLADMSKVVTKWALSLSLPVFLCFCIFHQAILSIFSKDYTAGGTVLIILSLGNLIDAGVGSVGYLLSMTGRARVVLANSVMTIVLNVGLGFFLVPRFNVIGAAVAAALTIIINNVAGLIEVYWILKIIPYRGDMLKPVVASGVASIAGLLLLPAIPVGYGYQAIFGILGLVIPFIVVYVLVLALLGFSKEDMMVFEAVRAKIGKKKSE